MGVLELNTGAYGFAASIRLAAWGTNTEGYACMGFKAFYEGASIGEFDTSREAEDKIIRRARKNLRKNLAKLDPRRIRKLRRPAP